MQAEKNEKGKGKGKIHVGKVAVSAKEWQMVIVCCDLAVSFSGSILGPLMTC